MSDTKLPVVGNCGTCGFLAVRMEMPGNVANATWHEVSDSNRRSGIFGSIHGPEGRWGAIPACTRGIFDIASDIKEKRKVFAPFPSGTPPQSPST